MKVLHVIPGISARDGGPSQAIVPMCRALRDAGVELLLATTDADLYGQDLEYGRTLDHKGLPVVFFPKQLGASFKYSRPFAQWLNTHVAEFDILHIHAVFNHACLAAAGACRRAQVPYVVRPLGTLDPWSMNQKSWRKRLFMYAGVKRMLSGARAIHYTTVGEQRAVEDSLGLNHGIVIPLGVEITFSDKAKPQNQFTQQLNERPYVLVLSRLLPTKGLDILLEAFLSLIEREEFKQWRLVLAGEGPDAYVASLKEKIQKAGRMDFVTFSGWVEGETKAAALRNASLLALPSYHENFGLCVIEALAYGVPVLISPQVNLAPQVEASGAGWVAPVHKEALQEALRRALGDHDERIRRGEAGRTLAESFSWPRVAGELRGLYENSCREKVSDPFIS